MTCVHLACACRIDELPARYQTATKIFLSNNSLTSLQGIQQFKGVQVLSPAARPIPCWPLPMQLAVHRCGRACIPTLANVSTME